MIGNSFFFRKSRPYRDYSFFSKMFSNLIKIYSNIFQILLSIIAPSLLSMEWNTLMQWSPRCKATFNHNRRHRSRALAWKQWNFEETHEVKQRRKFSPRKFAGRPPYETSTWGYMLSNPRFLGLTDRKCGQLFRRRFRVPFPVQGTPHNLTLQRGERDRRTLKQRNQ